MDGRQQEHRANGCRTEGMQARWDAGPEGCMQDRRDTGKVVCRTGGNVGMQERKDAGQEGC